MSETVRQSTARNVIVGPILDADGAAVTNGVVGDLKVSKNGAAPAALDGSATLTHRHTGHYSLALTATDVNTVGTAQITIDDTVNSMPPKELTVIEEVVYDALYAASANTFTGAAGSSKVTGVVLTDTLTTYTGNTLQTGDTFARLGAPAGASVSADIAAIEAQTDDIGAAGAGLTAADDAILTAIAALNNITAASVWAVGTRTLTAGTNIDGSTFTAIPWNASWDAEVQSEVQDALDGTIADSIPADGTRPSVSSGIYMMTQAIFECSISGTTMTIKKPDGSTTLLTVTLNDATTPTSKTRAT
jgi:hypothetical protein